MTPGIELSVDEILQPGAATSYSRARGMGGGTLSDHPGMLRMASGAPGNSQVIVS